MGGRVQVQVSRVDLDARRIDFRLVRAGEGERLLAQGRPDRTQGAEQSLVKVREADREAKAGRRKASVRNGVPKSKADDAGRGARKSAARPRRGRR